MLLLLCDCLWTNVNTATATATAVVHTQRYRRAEMMAASGGASLAVVSYARQRALALNTHASHDLASLVAVAVAALSTKVMEHKIRSET